MLEVDQARLFLRRKKEDIPDDELKQYLNYYTLVILDQLGDIAKQDEHITETPLFDQTLLAAIACQLSLTDVEIIHSPSEYQVGDTQEKYNNTSKGLYGDIPSWCSRYDGLLDTLTDKFADMKNLQVFRRTGMSIRRNWYRDLY